jgi:hypothetical protein
MTDSKGSNRRAYATLALLGVALEVTEATPPAAAPVRHWATVWLNMIEQENTNA